MFNATKARFGASLSLFALAVFSLLALPAFAQAAAASPPPLWSTVGAFLMAHALGIGLGFVGLCVALSHVTTPTTPFGVFVSWVAGNFGKFLSKTPPSALLLIGLLSFGARAQTSAPGPTAAPVTVSSFGGCVGPWTCFQPSIVVTPLAINLRTKVVEAAFQPGLGYGVTFHQGQWYSFGLDVYVDVDPGAQRAAIAVLGKAVNGYLRFGWSKGFIGDSNATAPRLLFGFGTDL